jgi:hypothetical protein
MNIARRVASVVPAVLAVCGLAVAMAGWAGRASAEPVQAVLVIGPAAPTATQSAIPGTIPGGGGADPRFTNFNNKIYRSPSSGLWLVVATTNMTPTSADQVLVIGNGLNLVGGTVAAREGVTATVTGDVLNFSRLDTPRINDAGQWAMGYRPVAGGTAADERLVKWDGTSLTTVLKFGDAIGAMPGQTFGGSFTGATIVNGGGVCVQATVAPFTGTVLDSVFGFSGDTLVVNVGTDVPTGQAAGGTQTWTDVDTGGFTQDATGAHWLALGLIGADATSNRVVVVDGAVRVQKGSVLDGSSYVLPVNTVSSAIMESNGDWFAIGTNADGAGWMIRNGAVIAAIGQPIVPGSTETWETFRDVKGNNAGNYVISGNTNAGTLTDDVLVLNGVRVIARESDPVDLNADGTFAGSLFVHLIQNNDTLNNDGYYYFATRLKSSPTATAGAGGSNNSSLLRVLACPADYNGSGSVNVQDIFDFLAGWFSGNLRADFNRSGTVNVQDIFDFLAGWFTGC